MKRSTHISDRLKLRQLKALLAVASTGSMGKAAKQLATSQSVVSKAIAELEEVLGVRLFDRSAQGVEPTLYGKTLVKRALAIFDDLRTSVNEIEFLADPGIGLLRIGTTLPQASVVAAAIQRLSRQYPRLDFTIVVAERATLLDRELRGRRIDLMVAPLQESPLEEDIESIFLYNNRVHVVVGVKSRWARRRCVTLADLIGESWCLPPMEAATGAVFFSAIHASGLPHPRVVVSSAAHQLCHRMLADGRFVGVSSNVTLHFDPARPALKELPIDLPAPHFPVGILTLKNRTILPVGQLFIDCALDIVRPLTKSRAKQPTKGK